MIYPAYEKYKDSGVEWIGMVPFDWKLSPLKYSTSTNDEVLSESTDADLIISYVEIGSVDIKKGIVQEDVLSFEEAPSRARRIVRNGDVIVSTVRTYLKAIAQIKNPKENLIVSTGFAVIRPRSIDTAFLSYMLRSSYFVERVVAKSVGVSYPAITSSALTRIEICIPPSSEQLTIANFLDRETARIDALIEKKHKLIEALNEKRIAVISHAVTKGLNPYAPLKDSGIEWLGKVPEHWEVKKLKYVGRLKNGETITADSFEDEGEFPVYGGNGFRGFYNNYTHEGDYVIIGRQGALCGNINYANGKFWASEHAVVVSIIKDDEVLWLGELLRIINLNQYSISAAQPGLAVDRISNLFIPVPPVDDQKVIVSYLKAEFKMINLINSKTQQAITKLEEYKTALISAAVTGKIKVPEITQANL